MKHLPSLVALTLTVGFSLGCRGCVSILRSADEIVEIGADGTRGASKAREGRRVGLEVAGEGAKPAVEYGVERLLEGGGDDCGDTCCDTWVYANTDGWCCAFSQPSRSANILSRPGGRMQCRPPMERHQGDTVWCCLNP